MAFVVHWRRFYENNNRSVQADNGGSSCQRGDQVLNRSNKRGATYFCVHYKISGHSKERYFKLNGYPPGWKHNKRADVAQSSDNEGNEAIENVNTDLTHEQYYQLLTILKQQIEGENHKNQHMIKEMLFWQVKFVYTPILN